MKWIASLVLLLFIAAAPSFAQLKIENPKHLEIPKEKAEVLYRTACRVVAEEFRLPNAERFEFPLTLVMGAEDERYTANDDTHAYIVYLKNWNETLFASSTMMLAIHRMAPPERQQQMLAHILKRAKAVAPVSVTELQNHK